MNLKIWLNRGKQDPSRQVGQDTAALPKKGAKKDKSKRMWIILGGIVVLAAVFIIIFTAQSGKAAETMAFSDTVVLARTDIQNTISATGTVESASSGSVYSTLNYPVKALYVKIGDTVQEGDLLCELDSEALEDQIEAQELSTGISAKTAAQQVKTARDAYNAAKDAVDEGLNTSIINAENQVRTSYDNWQKAQRTYNDYRATLNDGTNATLIAQDNAAEVAYNNLASAQAAYDAAKTAHETAQSLYNAAKASRDDKIKERDDAQAAFNLAQANRDADPTPENEAALVAAEAAYHAAETALTDAEAEMLTLKLDADDKQAKFNSANTALSNAQHNYDTAQAQRRAAYDNVDTTLSDYARAVDTAYNYTSALKSLEAAQNSVQTQLQGNKNSLASAQISGNTDSAVLKLAQMQEDLENTRIKAGASGTVTAVYAKVGASGTGLLFVIEDTQNLIVKTTVKGYDVGTVKAGMAVTIKSDATGDAVIDGKILSIAPTAMKNAQGQTDTMSDVLFATEVAVLSKDTGLRIGMSVRLKYIIERQADIVAVPYDSIYKNANGESCILIAEEQPGGKYMLRELVVTPGMENDLDVVVTGEGVMPGLRVLSNPESYLSLIGREVELTDLPRPAAAANGFGPMGMGR